ncbi:hypothetical protein OUZ56_027040 [Daphnia magna]|uniref:Secreted protein n=1 Tax=Daphnia magna TaxID=35525 RepID=A0ABQ9ZNK9_9CRUS|nr:hypothetical protein OUZ56_027040 [Daphnia magna]
MARRAAAPLKHLLLPSLTSFFFRLFDSVCFTNVEKELAAVSDNTSVRTDFRIGPAFSRQRREGFVQGSDWSRSLGVAFWSANEM